jgi:hypothetical protein
MGVSTAPLGDPAPFPRFGRGTRPWNGGRNILSLLTVRGGGVGGEVGVWVVGTDRHPLDPRTITGQRVSGATRWSWRSMATRTRPPGDERCYVPDYTYVFAHPFLHPLDFACRR